jgi:hypothetical protein
MLRIKHFVLFCTFYLILFPLPPSLPPTSYTVHGFLAHVLREQVPIIVQAGGKQGLVTTHTSISSH